MAAVMTGQIAWLLLGLSLLSVGFSLLYYVFKRRERYISLVGLGLLLVGSGVTSLIQGLPFLPDIDLRILLVLFVPVAVFCAVAAWPLAIRALRLPTHEQLLEYSQQLEQARDKALESDSLKRGFISNVRHELRTPLSGIIGMNELLLMGDLNDDQRRLAELAHESAESLLLLINELLDLSHAESGELSIRCEPIDPCAVVEQSIKLMGPAASDKDLQVELDIDPRCCFTAFGDALRLRQVLINLLDNAIKFTAAGTIMVSVVLVRADDGVAHVRFVVADSGMGISESEQKYLFEPFWQRDMSDTRRHGGAGLGLPLAKHLVTSMGGQGIAVRSKLGVGSTFSFVLPFEKQKDRSAPRREASSEPVIIATSNAVLRSNLGRYLALLDIRFSAVESLASVAFQQFRAASIILVDQSNLDGETERVVEQLHKSRSETGSGPAIIGLVAKGPRIIAPNFDDVLSKPVTFGGLRHVIQKWFWPSQTA